MSFETALAELLDLEQRISSQKLSDLSNLPDDDLRELADAWDTIDPERRLKAVNDLIEIAEDNVDMNFDGVFKLALKDEESYVRAAAIRGLYEYERRDIIGPLIDLLRLDTDPEVRLEAAIALGRYALAAELGYLVAADNLQVHDALMESAEDLEEDELVRARAIEGLGAISGEEIENLIESIYEEDSIWLKIGALDAMGRSCNENWLPLILREMQNPAPEMRHAAAFAAGQIGDEDAIEPLKQAAVLDPDHDVQLVAIQAIGEIGGARARVALKSVLYEADDSLEEAVQEALTALDFDDDPLRPVGL